MAGVIEELTRLEQAKHDALVAVDASAYGASVSEQMRILGSSRQAISEAATVERLVGLSQLIALNGRLLQNLLSTTPLFDFSGNYTALGRMFAPDPSGRISVEA